MHKLGIFFSIIGLWFTSAGVIGDENLNSIENKLRSLVRGKDLKSLIKTTDNKYIKLNLIIMIILFLPGIIGTLFGCGMLLLVPFALNDPSFYSKYLSGPFFTSRSNSFNMSAADLIASLSIVWIFVGGVLYYLRYFIVVPVSISIWLLLLPYRILDMFVEKKKMKSTIIVLGILLGTIGLILDL